MFEKLKRDLNFENPAVYLFVATCLQMVVRVGKCYRHATGDAQALETRDRYIAKDRLD